MKKILTKEEFLLFFEEQRDVRNAKRKALSQGYTVEAEGRGKKAMFAVALEPPEGYHYYKTLEEVKLLTGQEKTDRALRSFKNGHNVLKGIFVWYRRGASILSLTPMERVRYAFASQSLLADGYTYESLGRMVGVSAKSVGYYVKKIIEEDGIEEPMFRKVFRTGFVSNGHVYCLEKEDHNRLLKVYGPKYYDGNEEATRTFYTHGFKMVQYREKYIRMENVEQIKSSHKDERYEFLTKEKSPTEQERLNCLVRDIWRVSQSLH